VRLREISTDARIFLKIFVREAGTEVIAAEAFHRRDAENAEEGRKLWQQAETGLSG